MNLYFEGLGNRNPVTEFDQIIWFLEQMAGAKSKSVATRYWLDLKEQYSKRLIKLEAFELLDFIQSKSTAQQEIRRALSRIKTKAKNEKEMLEINKYVDKWQAKRKIIDELKISLN